MKKHIYFTGSRAGWKAKDFARFAKGLTSVFDIRLIPDGGGVHEWRMDYLEGVLGSRYVPLRELSVWRETKPYQYVNLAAGLTLARHRIEALDGDHLFLASASSASACHRADVRAKLEAALDDPFGIDFTFLNIDAGFYTPPRLF